MSLTRNVARLALTTVRQIGTTPTASSAAAKTIPEGYSQLKSVQARFQVKDGKPVHLKGGTLDKALYQFTMLLSIVGVGSILKLIYDLSVPKKE